MTLDDRIIEFESARDALVLAISESLGLIKFLNWLSTKLGGVDKC